MLVDRPLDAQRVHLLERGHDFRDEERGDHRAENRGRPPAQEQCTAVVSATPRFLTVRGQPHSFRITLAPYRYYDEFTAVLSSCCFI